MKVVQVRRFALSLPEVVEAPHFDYASFRVRGKIFATVPPDGDHLHAFVNEPERSIFAAAAPETYQPLWWGKKVVGLRVTLSKAKARDVEELLLSAWQRKTPKTLLAQGLPRRRRRPGSER